MNEVSKYQVWMDGLLGEWELHGYKSHLQASPFRELYHLVDLHILSDYLHGYPESTIYLFLDEVTNEDIAELQASLQERGFHTSAKDCVDWVILTVMWDTEKENTDSVRSEPPTPGPWPRPEPQPATTT
jgi:hypothetical protein